MKILIFYSSPIIPNSGGVQNVALSIANYLTKKNFDIFFLSLERAEENKTNYFFLPNKKKINSNLNIDYTLELLNQYSIDVILNLDGLNSSVLRFLLKFKEEVKIFNVIHNTFLPQNKIFNKYFKHSFKLFYLFVFYVLKQPYYFKLDRCSDKIILFSKSNLSDIKYFKKGKKFINKVNFIPNPINVSFNMPNFNKNNSLIYVGRLDDAHKNITFLLKLWNKLCFKYPNWNLFILGSGIDKVYLQNYSNRLNLININFLGNIDPKEYYKISKYLLLTSRFEGWPMVIPEAMSFGCIPCVVNSFTSLHDMIIDGFNGFLLDEFNLDKNINILEKLLNNNKSNTVKQNCIDTSKKYSIDIVGLKWLEILNT